MSQLKSKEDLARPESLEQSEECFKLLVASVQDYAIFVLDPQGNVKTWNLGAERIKGYRSDEIIGTHFSRFYSEVDVRAGKCEHELAAAARDGRIEDEGWRVRKDGSTFWANVVITSLRDASGELIGFAKVTRDLTARREAEKVALDLIEQQRKAIYALSVPIIEVWDRVLALPLVGMVDSARAAFLMTHLLDEVSRRGAQFAILDMTGVEAVDTATARYLLDLVNAVRLLGAEGIITGIRPAVAQTTVALGADLGNILTVATLRDGIVHCIQATRNHSA